jgi:hypothetical protein
MTIATTTKSDTTKRHTKRLQATPQEYARLYKKGEDGAILTVEEKAICELGYAVEHAHDVAELLAFTGFDVKFTDRPEWKIAEALVRAETLPTQAWAYRLIVGALLDTPGALEGIFFKLYTDLGQLPPTGDEITTIFHVIMSDGKVHHG